MELKKDIRKRVLAKRENISEEEWDKNSRIIYEKVVTHSFFLDEDTIYCYIDYRHEVCTRQIIEKAWDLHKKVMVPKVNGDFMTFHPIYSFSDLKEGYKGILEPITSSQEIYEPGLVIIPGVAFDRTRNRIGYGKGYYDRFLSNPSNYKTMAIGFELQLEETIPAESFDFKPDILITERHIYV